MNSAFAAGFFGQYSARSAERREAKREEEKELRDAARRREERLENLMFQRHSSMLPYIMERQEKIKELERVQRAARAKGLRLFGEKVTNTLENMGELQDVVAQYDATENSAEWASTIVARTEGFLDKMLSSEDEAQKETALKLMKKGSFFTNASAGEQTDFLSEFLATGTLSTTDLADMDLGDVGGTTYAGQVPSFGKSSVYTPVQLDRTAKELVASLVPGVEFQVIDGEYKLINPGNISVKAVELAVSEIASQIEDKQYTLGATDARRDVLKKYQDDNGLNLLLGEVGIERKVQVPDVPGADVPVDPNSMEVQESMTDLVQPSTVPTPVVDSNSWDPSAFDDEEDQNGR
jgi:hypothetical protein